MGLIAKSMLGLLLATGCAIAAARLAYEATAATGGESGNEPWAQDRMEFIAWNGAKWTAWIRDSTFELVPQVEGEWSRHSNASLAFIDWEGDTWQAKVDGEVFLLARRGDWKASVERASAVRYRDWVGRNQLRTVAQLRR